MAENNTDLHQLTRLYHSLKNITFQQLPSFTSEAEYQSKQVQPQLEIPYVDLHAASVTSLSGNTVEVIERESPQQTLTWESSTIETNNCKCIEKCLVQMNIGL
jgi:hypothetical protein